MPPPSAAVFERLVFGLKKRETRATRMLLNQDLESTWSEVRADLKATIAQRKQAERELQGLEQEADPLRGVDLAQTGAISAERIKHAKDWEQRRAIVTAWVRAIRVDAEETHIEFSRPAIPVPFSTNPQSKQS